MLAFSCPVCERLVTFESTRCLQCGSELGFDWSRLTMQAVSPAAARRPPYRCANAERAGCNWLVGSAGQLCASCTLTRTRPADGDRAGLGGFAVAEGAKRRLLFELADLGLPIVSWQQQSATCSRVTGPRRRPGTRMAS